MKFILRSVGLAGFCAVFLIARPCNAIAQNKKFGHINSEDIIRLMPESVEADSTLARFERELQNELYAMYKELEDLAKDYRDKFKERSEAVNRIKEENIRDKQQKFEDTQRIFQQEIMEKQQKVFAPIKEKFDKAVREVAKEMGLSYVFDSSMGTFIYYDESDDISAQVKKKLGISSSGTPPSQNK
ncbi:MAG: OmpH family outer membrane protein [Flavobacteriales bacterium]|nr:OmpH family outer membrane protein [Flavobacteriales bacterium]MCX7649698.1 OmpH family outer membrane protein [Flavobacteriales bacterium]MDW8432884.1 OmpH family outer membrane protein [Flavobacteriales bacterium]